MPLSYRVLGGPGDDNALFVMIDTGQRVSRLLFDCGDGCPHALEQGEVLAIDHLFFSHFHMDHVAGFDHFFRLNFDRAGRPVNVWVPPGGAEVMHHRFRGFQWNLVDHKQTGTWLVHEIWPDTVRSFRFEANEGFRTSHAQGERPRTTVVVEGDGYAVEAHQLDHGCPSMGYVVREASRVNVDSEKLASKGLPPGPWLKRLRGPASTASERVSIGGTEYSLADLQAEMLVTSVGESVAYLTDFRLTEATADYLAQCLHGVTTVVCESQYVSADRDLADTVRHSCADEVASLASRAGVGKLILFHLSPRYIPDGVRGLLTEALEIFPNTEFPVGWKIA